MEFFPNEQSLSHGMEVFMRNQHVSVVFVVDDEKIISRTLAIILRTHGFDASCFTSPLEALQNMKVAPPDLLISDVIMPELSGIELAIRVRKLYPQCRILLFSGQASTTDLLHSAHEQGHHFKLLPKPIHPTELLAEIEKLPG